MRSDFEQHLRSFISTAIAGGRERGIQLVVYKDGKLVADIALGTMGPADSRPVTGDTLFPVFSVSKGITATIIHRLVERGLIDYETPIAKVWPEFGQNGKTNVTLRHALCHQAGLPYMPQGVTFDDLPHWDLMAAKVAAMKPEFPPGSRAIYHAITQGWILGETARRITGKMISTLVREEVCKPIGVDSIYFGIPDEVESRVVTLDHIFQPGQEPKGIDDGVPRDIPAWIQPLHKYINRPDAKRTVMPASNGIMNARGIARHYAALLPGGVDGVELLPQSRVKVATKLQTPENPSDPPFMMALSYWLGSPNSELGEKSTTFGHTGHGGSTGFADPERNMAVGFTKNLYSDRCAMRDIMNEVRKTVD